MHEMRYSGDSFLRLENMVEIAKRRGLDGICITDHDSMGLKEFAAEYSEKTGFPIFVGIEFYSLQGDIVAFGIEDYPKEIHDILIYGTDGKEVKVYYKGQRGEGIYPVAFEGLIKNVERRYRETGSETMKAEYEEFMNITPCHACKGQRLKPGALAVTVGDKNIAELTGMSIEKLQAF